MHGAPVLRGERTCVSPFLTVRTLVTCVLLVLASIYRVPRLAPSCTREGFPFACKNAVPGCAYVECVFLLAGTAHTSIKFKSSCTVNVYA